VQGDAVEVSDNVSEQRYEARVGPDLAGFIDYRRQPGVTALLHAEVDPAFEGRGVGSRLAAGALDEIRARGDSVIPACPFVRVYIERHPEYADLVAGR
jgi:predicted GNAT family acetyltransferase